MGVGLLGMRVLAWQPGMWQCSPHEVVLHFVFGLSLLHAFLGV